MRTKHKRNVCTFTPSYVSLHTFEFKRNNTKGALLHKGLRAHYH
jgi:hypothetical protein